MSFIRPYDDLPGIDMESFGVDHFRTDTPRVGFNSYWTNLDPSLALMSQFDNYYNIHTTRHWQEMQDNLDEIANGYANPSPLNIPEQAFSRLDGNSAWPDQYSHQRYMGRTLSSTNSSPSERAYSPDVVRHLPNFAANSYPSPACEPSYMGSSTAWTQPQVFLGGLASPCPSSQASACNLKELQYTPDHTMEDDHGEDHDTIHVQVNVPEEIVLSPEIASPTDSSVANDDASSRDEDYEAAIDTDQDGEYVPNGAIRKNSSNSRRPATRSPRSTRTILTVASPTKILGSNVRVHKPGKSKSAAANSAKKVIPKTETDTAAKQFTCTFHHYGCDAKFASKNEWKRHVASQHLQLGFYRCDVGNCIVKHGANGTSGSNKGYNDFNRKDLFTQHHRRMHTPWGNPREGTKRQWEDFEESLEEVRNRCWQVRREPPARSTCGFCGKSFDDASTPSTNTVTSTNNGEIKAGSSWEERMEHVGKHFERQEYGDVGNGQSELEDLELTVWALREDVVREHPGRGIWLVGMEPPPVSVKSDGDANNKRRSSRRNTRDGGVPAQERDEEDALHEAE